MFSNEKNLFSYTRPGILNNGDRFIPSRSTTNFKLSHYKILEQQNADKTKNKDKENMNPKKEEMQHLLGKILYDSSIKNNTKMLSFQVRKSLRPLEVLHS